MPANALPEAELAALAHQVDDQFAALQSAPAATVRFRAVSAGERTELPGAPQQQGLIEQATREPFETFWQKYKRALRRDLCLPGGLLHDKWQKWRDLPSKDAVKVTVSVLTGMGVATAAVPTLAVAATVFLLNVLAKAGIEAVCEGCAEEKVARDQARTRAANGKSGQK
jgi:hypothetical protein